MYDFNNLSDTTKQQYCDKLGECAASFGGVNFFLRLLEAIRKTKPHPLMNKHCEFSFEFGTIKWNKVVFKDKLTLLMSSRQNRDEKGNLIPSKDAKNYKGIMNLVRTLRPIEFSVQPMSSDGGEGFGFYPFDVIDENTTLLNPIFEAIFFSNIENVKKMLIQKENK